KLKAELETYNSKAKLTTLPRYLSRPEKRQGKSNSSIVVCMQNAADAEYIIKHGVMAMGTHHKAEKHYSVRRWDQCTKCQDFGHHWQRCILDPRCRLCGQEHNTRDHQCDRCNIKGRRCPHTTLCCANCMEPHQASDPACEGAKAMAACIAKKEALLKTRPETTTQRPADKPTPPQSV